MRSHLHFTLLSALMMLIVSACTHEDSPRRQHVGEISADETVIQIPSKLSAAAQPVSADLVTRFKARLERGTLDSELRKQYLPDRQSLFDIVNEAGEAVSASPRDDQNRKAVLQTFSDVIFTGCAKLDRCTYVSLFKAQRGAVTMLLALADDATDIKLRYRNLSLAFVLVGRVDDPRIALAYVQTASAYEAELRKESTLESKLALTQHLEIFEISFAKLRQTLSEKDREEIYSGLEKTFELWNFDRARNLETAGREEGLFAIVANRFYEKKENLPSQLALLKQDPKSALTLFTSVKLPSRRAFGIKDELPEDLHTFLFDSVWTDRMTLAEANLLWSTYLATLNSTEEMQQARNSARDALLNYGRIRLLLSANAANAIITEFFSTPGKFVTSNAFNEGLKESVRAQAIWDDAKKRFEMLRHFNEGNLRSAEIGNKSNQEIRGFFASIDRNIKMVSTYPSMLVMTYHLARLGFSLKIFTWRGYFEIKGGEILDWFFDGILEPWMAYSSDYMPLSKSEISMVFYYALELGVLSEGGVNLDHLFKMLAEQMAGPLRLEVEGMSDAYQTKYETSPVATEFHRICAMLAEQKAAGKSVPFSAPMDFDNLINYTIMGMPEAMGVASKIHPTFHAGWGFFEGERINLRQNLDETLEIVRLELTPKIDRIRLLARLSDDYLKRHENADREKTMRAIEDKIQPLEAVRKRFYTQMFALAKVNGPCGESLIENEMNSQRFVINGLAVHFRDVYAKMKAARAAGDKGLTLKKDFGFSGSVRLADLATHERGLGYNSEMYRLSRLQVLLRIKHLLENGYTEKGIAHAPRRSRDSIQLPARLRDIRWRLREDTLRLDWNDDIDEFVTSGIEQIFDQKKSFVEWSGLGAYAMSLNMTARAMSSLAKSGVVQTDSGPQRMSPKEVIRMSLSLLKWLEINNPEWSNLLAITGEFTRIGVPSILGMFAWEAKSEQWRGSLDYVLEYIRTDKLSDGESPRTKNQQGVRQRYVEHMQAMKAFGDPALKIPPTAMSELADFYRQKMDVQMEIASEVIDETARLEILRMRNPELFPSWRIFTTRTWPKVKVLSDSEFEAFRLETYELVRSTGYVVPARVEKSLKR